MKKFLIFMILFFVVAVQASAHTGTDIYSGSWPETTAAALNVQVAESAYDYYTLVENGAFPWNGISSKLYIKTVNYDSQVDADSDLVEDITVRGVDLGATGAYADALNYKKTWWGGYSDSWDSTWAVSRVRINTNPDNFAKLSNIRQQETITHEFGHVVALKHNQDTSEDSKAIMRQFGFNDKTVPLEHDIAMIEFKY